MSKAVKIRTLPFPPEPFDEFDPGAYLGSLEFYETDAPITEQDRDGLAQFAHLLAFVALQARSVRWAGSVIPQGSLADRALQTHFGHLPDWPALPPGGLPYRQLAGLLMKHYPPRMPKDSKK
jgi:hypothetical protein